MDYHIRDAQIEDLPAIVEIYNASIPGRAATADLEPVSVESRISWFDAHQSCDRPLWVCVQSLSHEIPPMPNSALIIGWISLNTFYGRPAYDFTAEVSVYIAPQMQGRGIGSLLLQRLIAHCQTNSVRTLMSFVFAHNPASQSLFLKFGFEQWGYLPKIAAMDNMDRDVVILGKRLK